MTARLREYAKRFSRRLRIAGRDECWIWTGATSRGYGACSDPFRPDENARAHRVAWLLCRGPLLEGSVVAHACDNRRCCNPRHLVACSQGENLRDMVRKGRHASQRKTHCPAGHALVGENLVKNELPRRRCRTCSNARNKAYWRARRKAEGKHPRLKRRRADPDYTHLPALRESARAAAVRLVEVPA